MKQHDARLQACQATLLVVCVQDMARSILPLIAPKLLDHTPYIIISHSMGSWVAFEMLQLFRQFGAWLVLCVLCRQA
jgi:surfactin synthase thioesterase subunit